MSDIYMARVSMATRIEVRVVSGGKGPRSMPPSPRGWRDIFLDGYCLVGYRSFYMMPPVDEDARG